MKKISIPISKGTYLDRSPNQLPEGYVSHADGFRFSDDCAKQMGGVEFYYNVGDDDVVNHLLSFKDSSGVHYVFKFCTNLIKRLTADSHGDIGRIVLTGLSNTNTFLSSPWSSCIWQGTKILCANGLDLTRKIESPYMILEDLHSANQIRDPDTGVSKGLPYGKIIRIFQNHLFILGEVRFDGTPFTSYPMRVCWSNLDDPSDFDMTKETTEAGFVDLSESTLPIVGAEGLLDYLVVYTNNQIHVFQYVGGNYVFQRRVVDYTNGLWYSRLLVSIGNQHYFMSNRHFFMFDGMRTINIGEPVNDFVFEILHRNGKKMDRAFAFPVKEQNEIWWLLPLTTNEPDTALIYNYLNQTWTMRTFAAGITAGIDALPSLMPIYSNTVGQLLSLNSEGSWTPTASLITAEIGDGQNYWMITEVWPQIDSQNSVNIELGWRNHQSQDITWESTQIFDPRIQRKLNFHKCAKYFRVKISANCACKVYNVSLTGEQEGEL